MKFFVLPFIFAALVSRAGAQIRTTSKAAATPAILPARSTVDMGAVTGQTYTNRAFRFEVTFPGDWTLSQGDARNLKAPYSLAPASRAKLDRALRNVTVVLTAEASPAAKDSATVVVSIEDLTANPQIKDAVDYFDAMRSAFASMRLPAGFRYSETGAEKLGAQQFGFLDTSTKDGKKRLYATVRSGFAVMFTLSYTKDEDLHTFRKVLGDGNFALK